MSTRAPSLRLDQGQRRGGQRHLGWPDPGLLALSLVWFIVIVCAAIGGLAMSGLE